MRKFISLHVQTFTTLFFLVLFVNAANAQCTFTVGASSSTLCAGQTVTLSATGTSSYTWSPGGVGSTVVHTLSATQTYTVSGSDGVCTTTQTITITVIATPTVAASSSTPVICSGFSAILTYTGNAGGSNSGYYWLPGMSSASSITVSPSASTIYTVIAYNAGGACTGSATIQLPVYANPNLTFTVSESSLCSGNQLTITPGGASAYTLQPGSYTTSSEFYIVAASVPYTVTGRDGNSCESRAAVPVTVSPTPSLVVAQTPSFVCAGTSATLYTSGADAYNWQPGNQSSGTVVITPSVSVPYTVTGYNSTGCTSSTTGDLVVTPSPTLVFVNTTFSICQGSPITLSVSGASTYTWLPSGNTGSMLTVNPSGNTVYTVTGTHINTCTHTNYATV